MSMPDNHNDPSHPETNHTDHRTPFASPEIHPNSENPLPQNPPTSLPKHASPPTPSSVPSSLPLAPLYFFMAIHFLLAYSELILVAPLIALFEQSLCIAYYSDSGNIHSDHYLFGGSIPEWEKCKIQAIQVPLATIRGWKSLLDTIPVLLIAVSFGKLADRYGRRKLLAICLLGVAASFGEVFVVCAFPRVFPLQMVWLSSLILFCGGGLYSAAALMWAMAAEAFPEERRSQAFYYIFAAFYVAELVGSFTAAVTTDISPWVSCGLSMTAISVCLLLLWLMPESPRLIPLASADTPKPLTPINENSALLTTAKPPKKSSSPVNSISRALSNKNILLTLPVFLTGSLRFTILNILIQYASNRFNLKISTGALFYTETALVNMLLFLLAVPLLVSHIRTKHRNHVHAPQTVDLYMARACVALLCLGSLLIGLAPSAHILPIGVLVFAAGFGSRVSTLSLASYWISEDARAMLYAAIAVVENVGHAVGDPGLQQIFAATLRLGWSPFWQALPFFVPAGLYCVAGLSTMLIGTGEVTAVLVPGRHG